jgi:CRP-like cAMP-binding protein
MKWKINPNAVNQFSKGTDIYTEGEAVFSIALIIKGRIQVHNNGAKYTVNSGVFLGVNDLYAGNYQSTYTALDDAILYIFAISRIEELDTVLSINKDYHGFMVASLNRMILELDKIYQAMMKNGLALYQFLQDQYKYYLDTSKKLGYTSDNTRRISTLTVPESDLELERDRINYYKECAGLPIDVVKAFYSYGNAITFYQVEDQVEIVNQQMEILKELSDKLTHMTGCLIDDSNGCLFHLIAALAIEIENNNGNSSAVMEVMDVIIEKINQIETFYEQMLGKKIVVNRRKMEEAYHLLLTGTRGKEISTEACLKYTVQDAERVLRELNSSFQTLLLYSGIDSDKAEEMMEDMNSFVNLKDRLSGDDSARAIRRRLTDHHYLLYKIIFLKAYHEKKVPRIVDLFLKYGYADERLMPKEHLLSLYYLEEEKAQESEIHIYNIKEWLTLVYEGKKQPSKNEFDLDYTEMLASLKKQGGFSEKELLEWAVSPEKKLDYEIQNMFRYNNKTTNGQISTFVPVLHKDIIINQFDKSYVCPSKILEAMAELIRIDFSIFDREVLYADKEKKIVKEYIVKRVYPDIIMMPTVGTNGIMWQEITGKRRDSSARFLLPIFCETNLMAILVRMFGRFRWEMCRSIEGTAWNDIKHKSLTSEYSDYLQFYRKNRDLSEEKKEKLKLQIQRGRNSREIFVIDYEQWINYEATGAIKLNKPVRELMATYCPFGKEIRNLLIIQPMFEEAYGRYNRDKLKKVREIEGRYRLLQKDQIEITKELTDTLNYYKDL